MTVREFVSALVVTARDEWRHTARSPSANERLVGKAVRGRRDKVLIATKFGREFDDDGRPAGGVTGRPEYVRRALDRSLERLGTDTVDLYYVHRVDDSASASSRTRVTLGRRRAAP